MTILTGVAILIPLIIAVIVGNIALMKKYSHIEMIAKLSATLIKPFEPLIERVTDVKDTILEFKNERPKLFKASVILTLIATLAVGFYGYIFVTRAPNAVSCTWDSIVTQSIPSDKWRFNWYGTDYTKQCQYFNGSRWIPQNKVVDVGSSEVDDLE